MIHGTAQGVLMGVALIVMLVAYFALPGWVWFMLMPALFALAFWVRASAASHSSR